MFKNIRENDYVKKFVELWNNPRYRSIIILVVYIIFFAFVIASINSSRPTTSGTNKVDIRSSYAQMNNYRYQATIKNESEQKIVGRVADNKQIIVFDETNYYYNNVYLYKQEEKIYKQTDEQLLDFEIWRMTPTFINSLIEKGSFESKTEYANGEVANTYLVNVDNFIELYFGDEAETEETISVTLHQNNERVLKVELDLTPIYHQQQFSNQYDYEVTIEYDMIEQINPIVVNVESSD